NQNLHMTERYGHSKSRAVYFPTAAILDRHPGVRQWRGFRESSDTQPCSTRNQDACCATTSSQELRARSRYEGRKLVPTSLRHYANAGRRGAIAASAGREGQYPSVRYMPPSSGADRTAAT